MATDSFQLHELNAKSGPVGTWILKVYNMRMITYEYNRGGQPRQGQKLECMFVSKDGVYCQGVIKSVYKTAKTSGPLDPAAELRQMQERFQNGTMWKMTKVTLADEKSQFISSALKNVSTCEKQNASR